MVPWPHIALSLATHPSVFFLGNTAALSDSGHLLPPIQDHRRPDIASYALAIAVEHGLLFYLDPPLFIRHDRRWLFAWLPRASVAPLCSAVATAHHARAPADRQAARWYRGRLGLLVLFSQRAHREPSQRHLAN